MVLLGREWGINQKALGMLLALSTFSVPREPPGKLQTRLVCINRTLAAKN